jgi:hypothetical protein
MCSSFGEMALNKVLVVHRNILVGALNEDMETL